MQHSSPIKKRSSRPRRASTGETTDGAHRRETEPSSSRSGHRRNATEFGAYSDAYGNRFSPRLFVTNPDPETIAEDLIQGTRPHARHPAATLPVRTDDLIFPSSIDPECGVCGDKILLLNDHPVPLLDTTSSSRPVGIALRCHGMIIGHTYCFPCISTYLKTALSEASFRTVFPIRCPQCPYIIMDQQAERILDRREMEGLWQWAQLFEEVQTFYCPSAKCGTRIELPSPECARSLRKAECPECKEVFCFRCQSVWHEGQSCAKFAHSSGAAALDKALEKLARQSNWRRCPKCRIVIERDEGCRHIVCRCGYEFCYRCGRQWRSSCGQYRSILCFPVKPESWPETRSRIVDFVHDTFKISK